LHKELVAVREITLEALQRTEAVVPGSNPSKVMNKASSHQPWSFSGSVATKIGHVGLPNLTTATQDFLVTVEQAPKKKLDLLFLRRSMTALKGREEWQAKLLRSNSIKYCRRRNANFR
jgi:hypothetical protein